MKVQRRLNRRRVRSGRGNTRRGRQQRHTASVSSFARVAVERKYMLYITYRRYECELYAMAVSLFCVCIKQKIHLIHPLGYQMQKEDRGLQRGVCVVSGVHRIT